MKKLLLTGATGFLGSHVRRKIPKDQFGTFFFAGHEDESAEIWKMDITDFNKVKSEVEKTKPDIIVHLGAKVDLRRDYAVARQCIESNLAGTLNLLESTRSASPSLFIYVSTEEVYGDAPVPYKEDAVPFPPSPYAMTKLGGEHLVKMYGNYFGFSVIILRIGTMYGPGESVKRFIPSSIIKALKNEEIPLNSGQKFRDYVYVEDVADALFLSICLPVDPDIKEVINIGGGAAYTLKSVIEKIVEISQSSSDIRLNAFPDREHESSDWRMNIEKAKSILHWEPKTSLKEGLMKTIEYYKMYH